MSVDELKTKLADLWKKSRPLMMRRLEVINRAHQAIVEGALTQSLKEEAGQEAHKLAGALGVFGLHDGSASALEIEEILLSGNPPTAEEIARLSQSLERLTHDIKSR